MTNVISTKVIQTITLVFAWVWAQASEMTGGIIGRGFDQLFSIGLLLIVVYMLWRQGQDAQEYNKERDNRIERLVESNTEAINGFRRSNQALTTAIRELRTDMQRNSETQNN